MGTEHLKSYNILKYNDGINVLWGESFLQISCSPQIRRKLSFHLACSQVASGNLTLSCWKEKQILHQPEMERAFAHKSKSYWVCPRPHSLQHQLQASPSDLVPKTFRSAKQHICNPQPLTGPSGRTRTKQLLAVQDSSLKVKTATEHLFPSGKGRKIVILVQRK